MSLYNPGSVPVQACPHSAHSLPTLRADTLKAYNRLCVCPHRQRGRANRRLRRPGSGSRFAQHTPQGK
jgi:hypothetical protein